MQTLNLGVASMLKGATFPRGMHESVDSCGNFWVNRIYSFSKESLNIYSSSYNLKCTLNILYKGQSIWDGRQNFEKIKGQDLALSYILRDKKAPFS